MIVLALCSLSMIVPIARSEMKFTAALDEANARMNDQQRLVESLTVTTANHVVEIALLHKELGALTSELRSLTGRVNTLAERPTTRTVSIAPPSTPAIRGAFDTNHDAVFSTGSGPSGWYLHASDKGQTNGSFTWGNEPVVLPDRRPVVSAPSRANTMP